VKPASAEAASLHRPTIQERFDAWLSANPDVYPTIVSLAREAKAAGKRAIGMKALWEVARWTLSMRTRGDDYRWNNDYTSLMSRLVQEREPDLRGLFEVRRRRSQ
jgi:4-amino-4-deoxy-L-arabinose transferase-like glycosyltransferase